MGKKAFECTLAIVMSVLLMMPVSGFASLPAQNDATGGMVAGALADGDDSDDSAPVASDLAPGAYYLRSSVSGVMRMIAYSGSNVVLKVASGDAPQQWRVTAGDDDGYVKIENAKTGKVLSVVPGGDGELPGASVVVADEDSADAGQKWKAERDGERFRFLSSLDTGFALTVAATGSAKLGERDDALGTQLFSALSLSSVKRTIKNRGNVGEGTYYIQPSCLATHVLSAKGSNARLDVTAGTNVQRWKLSVGRDGYATLKNVKTKKVLSVKGGKAVGAANVVQSTAKTSVDSNAAGTVMAKENLGQKWVVKKSGKKLMIRSALNTGYALYASTAKNGYNVELRKASSANSRELFSFVAQKPKAAKRGKRTVKDGVYLLAPTAKAKQVLAIAGSSKKSGANARIAAFAASAKQTFRITYDKKGFYAVVNVFSGKRLAPVAACSVPNINVGQYGLGDSNDRAKWRIDKYGSGYRLVNKATGLSLEMASSKHPNGTNVCASTTRKTAVQRFSLVRPSSLSPAASKVKGIRYVVMASNGGRVVGTRNDSRGEGDSVSVRKKRDTNLQRFSIKSAGGGTYYLQNIMTKRVMSLQSKSKASDVNVVMRWQNGESYQRWKVVYNDDFSYAFVNAYSGKHLHVTGASTSENANVKVHSALTSAASQKFRVVATAARTNESVILDVPCYWQNPELPTGCESVALTNALRYWGFGISKTEIADRWMPYGSDGVWNFIGNPRNSSGWIICAPGIANTARSFLRSRGSSMGVEAIKGRSLSSLREYLDRGEPLVVWTTIGMGYPGTVQWWNSGYPMRSNNHAVVVSGYDPNTGDYLVSDSLAGKVWRNGSWFEWLYNEMGRQAVVIYR